MFNLITSKKVFEILFLAVILMSAGCATIEGAGKDIEKAGEVVQDAVNGE